MLSFKEFITVEIDSIDERSMSPYHKQAIARAHRGNKHSNETKAKIGKSMAGKKNHQGKKHSEGSKDRISIARGSYDPIQGKSWIVNRSDKTYRRYHAPIGFKQHKRKYDD